MQSVRRSGPSFRPCLIRADRFLLKKIATSAFMFLKEVAADQNHSLRKEFDRFVALFIEKIATSPEYAAKLETFKRDFISDPSVADFTQSMWASFRRFLQQNARSPNSVLHAHLCGLLIEAGYKLADDPRIRAHINHGIVALLESFVQEHKGGVATFIANQVKAWDIDQLVRLIEINIGKDLQFIRFNGAMVGGLAGLMLYTGEILLKLA